jgi:hypothetical protein
MRTALPNASFLGFTGTPLIAGEAQRTREVFGDYVSTLGRVAENRLAKHRPERLWPVVAHVGH